MLAVLSEGIAYGQMHVRKLPKKNKILQKKFNAILYGFEQSVSWILMLISMMFSVELFCSVILGIFVGKILFTPSLAVLSSPYPRIGTSGSSNNNSNIFQGNNNHNAIAEELPLLISQSSRNEITNNIRTDHHQYHRHSCCSKGDGGETTIADEGRISPSSGNEPSTTAVRRRRRDIMSTDP